MTRTRPVERPGQRVRRLLLGPPISSSQEQQERLGKPTALAILSGAFVFALASASVVAYLLSRRLVIRLEHLGRGLGQARPIAFVAFLER